MRRPTITISREAMDDLALNSLMVGRVFRPGRGTVELPGHRWRFPLDQDVFDALRRTRRPGESYSAVILRIARGNR